MRPLTIKLGFNNADTGWSPAFAGTLVWFRGDLGLTTVDAAIADGNDISAASWTPSDATVLDSQTIRDTTATAVPFVYQVPTGLDAAAQSIISCELKTGTKQWALFQLYSGLAVYVDLVNGVLFANAQVAEIIGFAGIQSAAVISQVQAYLHARYGL